MAWVILILVLLAAAFGVLGAVIKAVAFLVLTILLTLAALAAMVWYGFRHQIRRWERESGLRTRSRRDTAAGEPPRGLPTRDDRY
jgi:peptidoglycan/LPS O-acetylase OafA/YrhL